MGWASGLAPNRSARPRVIRGTRAAPLPLLPSGPGGVCGRPLHGARDLTNIHRITGFTGSSFLAKHGAGLKQTADSDDGDVGVLGPMTRLASLHFEEGLCGLT